MSRDKANSVSSSYAKRSNISEIWRLLKRNKGAMIGLIVILVLILIAIYTTIFIDYNTTIVMVNLSNGARPPSSAHLFGTDDMGRDMFWRTLYGTRYSLIIGIGATLFSLIVGVFLGAIAGFFSGIVDDVIMRASDILASIPAILLGMVIVVVLGTNLNNLLIAVGVTAAPAFVRITRASVLSIRHHEFIESSTSIGMSSFRTTFTQALPNSLSPIIVSASSRIGSCTIQAAGLSILGFGVPAPTPEWGALISLGRNYIRTAPWMTLFPGVFIIITVLAFNLLGDGLRDALDPKLKRVVGSTRKKHITYVDNTAGNVSIEEDIVLDVDGLVVHYELEDGTVEAVNDISFSLKRGKTIGLVGETGAGKTTTALSILNLIPDPPGVVKSGRITVCGNDMLKLGPNQLEKIRGKDVSMIFQDPMTSLNPLMTVGRQIAESVQLHEHVSKSEAFTRAQDMLELVGIPKVRANEYPHQFSGGMKQRVIIAIALACNPKVLLADEPTTALDVTIQAQVLDMMNVLKEKLGTSLVMITHDLGVVAKICDEVAVMYAGKLVEHGTIDEVFFNTKHPYTEGLFNSLPDVADRHNELKPIPGLMPDPTKLPDGCAFAPRCRYAADVCMDARPKAKEFTKTHYALCCRHEEAGFHLQMNGGGVVD